MRARVIAVALAPLVACNEPDRQVSQPPSKLPSVRVVDLIPASLSGETWQDAEPFLALYDSNPKLMAASAFTPNPGGSTSATAPIFVTNDGGDSWTLRNTLPSEGLTADITHAVGGGPPVLYAGILKVPGVPLNELKTNDFLSPATMTLQASRADIDQPFVRTAQVASADHVYVGLNDFDAPDGRTATVDGRAMVVASDVVVVRDDHGATGATSFKDLVDPSDHLPGRLVATHVTIPWSNAPTLGQERIGSTLSLAVNPRHSDTVYLAWADRVGNGDIYTVHVRRSGDRGATWTGDLRTVTNATDASLAVAANGTVGLLYQQLTGAADASRWVTQLEQSRDGFATHQDVVLATVPATTPAFQFLPYLGDYNGLLSRGPVFLGIFSANNTPDSTNFPQGVVYQRRVDFATHRLLDGSGAGGGAAVAVSIDPFFFSVPVLP
ncbi:MAG: hypothetical protein DMD73_06195 [Gemmatimonadetes bacterium]|nr:MAG: hypothetical protein DMD73_06195 [Gemmatimonadota bacterium]